MITALQSTHCASCSPSQLALAAGTCPAVVGLQEQIAVLLARMDAILSQQQVPQVINVTYHISGGQFIAGDVSGGAIHAEQNSRVMASGNTGCIQAEHSQVNNQRDGNSSKMMS